MPSLFLLIYSKSSSFLMTQLKSTLHGFLPISQRLIPPQPGQGSLLDHRRRFQLLLPLPSLPSNPPVTSPACAPPLSPSSHLVLRARRGQQKVGPL